jgi:hypothetical protein
MQLCIMYIISHLARPHPLCWNCAHGHHCPPPPLLHWSLPACLIGLLLSMSWQDNHSLICLDEAPVVLRSFNIKAIRRGGFWAAPALF